ncbi:toxin [Pseudomonas syringae]|nr:RHS repeat-associated core domain-containing protein [Pseudomonas syringae]MCI3946925.1 toxin [Pseudomonas syringae]
MNGAVHAHTPTLAATDPRSLTVRGIAFLRQHSSQPAEGRVTLQTYDVAGRLIAQRDSRLSSDALPNISTLHSLSGLPLLTNTVDAGWRLVLPGEAGQKLTGWDGRGSEQNIAYDVMLRPLTITEQSRVVERFSYGDMHATVGHNQCNQLVRHDDTAGTRFYPDYALSGPSLTEARRFILSRTTPDWPLAETERDTLLEPIPLQSRWRFNALGEVIEQSDAMCNRQVFGLTVAGQSKTLSLTPAGISQPQPLLADTRYNAFNQVEQETSGNGVVTHYSYDQQDGRLTELSALSADGSVLQALNYSYDPVGNVALINDTSQPDRYCDNQLIEPINRYHYDTLYQLIEATGREVRNGASHGPALPGLQPLPMIDSCQVSNYKQRYHYDAAGNLLQMRHEGAHDFTRNMRVAPDSNRSLPDDDSEVDFNANFDANGNLLQLVRGQTMSWNVRNQLERLTTVQRKQEPNDDERYLYDGQGQRCRKITTSRASGRTLTHEVRYLPGLEIRTSADGEILHVITAQTGRNSVRVLHWETGKPAGIANDQVRYIVGDHLGSSTLELDHRGSVISHESYYPFGGTAWWAARSAVEAKYKTVRYSGKERDASGLYYYGFRYYAPWLQRWINPDPAGDVGGLNQFIFVVNNPLSNADTSGLVPYQVTGLEDRLAQARSKSIEHYQFVEKTFAIRGEFLESTQ